MSAHTPSPHAAKNWCFTLNNPSDGFQETLSSLPGVRYIIFQLEKGEKGTRHVQGYLQLERKKRFAQLCALIPRAHLELARGSPADNVRYCSKEESRIEGPWESGEILSSGTRTDLQRLHDALRSNTRFRDLWNDHFSSCLRYHTGVRKYLLDHSSGRRERPIIFTLWGPSGTGKTRLAREVFQDDDEVYWKDTSTEWFDGYDSQEVVIFDEFYGGIQLSLMLRILDRYPCMIQCKGAYMYLKANIFVITSNAPPSEWYSKAKRDTRLALMRRLTEYGTIVEFPIQ